LETVLLLHVPDEQIVERLLSRGRTDDTRETIEHRLEVYRNQTEPVLRYLESRGAVIDQIDGFGTIEEITERIEGVLDADHQTQEP
jgi:adenylate kinase